MVLKIGTNIESIRAQRRLSAADEALGSVYERLSSGQRINKASDDAASLAISERLRADQRVQGQASRNINDTASVLNVADGALSALTDILGRQQELATQAANGTLSNTQRASLDKESVALVAEYNRIINTTTFNGVNIFTGQNAAIGVQVGRDVLTVKTTEITPGASGAVTGTGSYTSESEVTSSGSTDSEPLRFLAGDVNGDAISDLIIFSLNNRGTPSDESRLLTEIYLGRSSGSGFTLHSSYQNQLDISGYDDAGWALFRARFTNGNDILVEANTSTSNYAGTLVVGATGLITSDTPGSYSGGDASVTNTIIADFNGDGVSDSAVKDDSQSWTFNIQQTTTSAAAAPTSAIIDSATTLATISLASRSSALSSLTTLDTVRSTVSTARGLVGTGLARLQVAGAVTEATRLAYASADDRLRSADVAQEAADMARLSILRNASASVLAQANLQPQLALKLLAK